MTVGRAPASPIVDLRNLPKVVNPKYYPYLKGKRARSRYFVLWGGGSSGKSVFAAQKIVFRCLAEAGHRFLIVRKVKDDLRDSCFEEIKGIIRDWGLEELFYIPTGRSGNLFIKSANGNEMLFYGLDDVERRKSIRGITSMWIEEASEITPEDFRQLDIRMRGKTKHYRQIILSFNPISITHWLKKEFFDKEKEGAVTLHSTFHDNKFLDKESRRVLESFKLVDEYYYMVYCLGQWGILGKTIYPKILITNRLQQLKNNKPIKQGFFEYDYHMQEIKDDTIKFVDDPDGPIRIYEYPMYKFPYVLGGDTAEGGEDYCTSSVRNNISWNQAATYRERTDTDLYAKQMYCLGRLYNDALIGIETNFDLHPTKELMRLGYPLQYRREVVDSITKKPQEKLGYKTTKLTRSAMLSKHVSLARDHVSLFNDFNTLEEMLSFVRNDMGKPEAAEGMNDDLIFADAIALEIRGQQSSDMLDNDKVVMPGGFPGHGGYAEGFDFDRELGRDEFDDEGDDMDFFGR